MKRMANVLAKLVQLGSATWDFIDQRGIDKHLTAWSVFAVTVQLLIWSKHFAETSPRPGSDVAEILAAIWGPWNIVQTAVVSWYFSIKPLALLRGGRDGDMGDGR